MKRFRFALMLFAFYFLIAVVITYPLIFNFNSTIYGIPERTVDSFGTIYYRFFLQKENSLDLPYMVIIGGVGQWLATLVNEVFAYNFLILLSFPLAGIAMYLLAYHLMKNRWASALAGFIFAFAPLHRRYSFEWLNHAQWHWLPLYVLALLKLDKHKSIKWGLLTGLIFSIVFMEDYYFGFFAIFFTIFFVLFRVVQVWLSKKKLYFDRERVTAYLLAFAVVAVLTLPITATFVGETQRLAVGEREEISGFAHDEWPRFAFSARPWFYLFPDIHHPIFGDTVQKVYDWLATKPPLFLTKPFYPREHSLFLGWTTLILSAVAVFRLPTSGGSTRRRIWLFLFLGIVMIIFSAPPFATINLRKIYFPSHYLYNLFPMFRSYARFGVLVLLCFSVLAAFGLKIIFEKFRSRKSLLILSSFFFILFFFEFLDVPPFHSVSLKTLPVYEWVARQPGDFGILVYPQDLSNRDLLAERTHGKRFLNPKGGTPPEVREVLDYLDEEDAVNKLRQWGVRYLIVRDPQSDPQKDPDYWDDLGFEDFADLVSKLDFERNYRLVKIYDTPRVYLFEVPTL